MIAAIDDGRTRLLDSGRPSFKTASGSYAGLPDQTSQFQVLPRLSQPRHQARKAMILRGRSPPSERPWKVCLLQLKRRLQRHRRPVKTATAKLRVSIRSTSQLHISCPTRGRAWAKACAISSTLLEVYSLFLPLLRSARSTAFAAISRNRSLMKCWWHIRPAKLSSLFLHYICKISLPHNPTRSNRFRDPKSQALWRSG